jgi:hypothetical protein
MMMCQKERERERESGSHKDKKEERNDPAAGVCPLS